MGLGARLVWCGLIAAACAACDPGRREIANGELGDKRGWAALQGLELAHREAPGGCRESIVRPAGDGLLALGVPGVGKPLGEPREGCRAWLLLNEHAGDREVKLMPEFAAYRLGCAEVARLPGSAPATDGYVLAYLRSICTQADHPAPSP